MFSKSGLRCSQPNLQTIEASFQTGAINSTAIIVKSIYFKLVRLEVVAFRVLILVPAL